MSIENDHEKFLYQMTDDKIREELHRRTLNRKVAGENRGTEAQALGLNAPSTHGPDAPGQSNDQWNRSLADIEHEKAYWLRTALDAYITLPTQANANALMDRMDQFHEAWMVGRKRVLG